MWVDASNILHVHILAGCFASTNHSKVWSLCRCVWERTKLQGCGLVWREAVCCWWHNFRDHTAIAGWVQTMSCWSAYIGRLSLYCIYMYTRWLYCFFSVQDFLLVVVMKVVLGLTKLYCADVCTNLIMLTIPLFTVSAFHQEVSYYANTYCLLGTYSVIYMSYHCQHVSLPLYYTTLSSSKSIEYSHTRM